jgi:peptidoglycan/LPS O-acetylase OafA/YrhL
MKATDRQNNFNLLRLVLAMLVILSHSSELIDGNRSRELLSRIFGTHSFGDLAVGGFFLLSGYLIMQSWEIQPQPWQFIKKRVLRIYPAFIVASLACAVCVGPLAADPDRYFASFDVLAFLKGLLFLQKPVVPSVFVGQPYPVINGALWTICREFCCYMLVLAAGISGALRIRHLWLAVTAVVLALILVPNLVQVPGIDSRDLRLASFFMSGGCFYIYRKNLSFRGPLAALFAVAACLALFSWRATDLALPTVGAYGLLYAASKRSALLSRFNRLPDVSYGVYLYGWPIQKLFVWYYPSISPWLMAALSMGLALLAGTASWYLIEKPALRLKGPAFAPAEPTSTPVMT